MMLFGASVRKTTEKSWKNCEGWVPLELDAMGRPIFRGRHSQSLPELAGESALIRVAAVQGNRRNRIIGFQQQSNRGFHPGLLDQLSGGELKQFSDTLFKLIRRETGSRGQIRDPQSFAVMFLDILNGVGDGRIVFAALVRGVQIPGNAHQANHQALTIPQRKLVGQTPTPAAGRIEMELKLIQDGGAILQDTLVLGAIGFAQGRGKQFISSPADQLIFFMAVAALHEGLIDDDILATAVFDEKDHVREAVKQGFAGKGIGELGEKLGLQGIGFVGFHRCAKILVATGIPDKTLLAFRDRMSPVNINYD